MSLGYLFNVVGIHLVTIHLANFIIIIEVSFLLGRQFWLKLYTHIE